VFPLNVEVNLYNGCSTSLVSRGVGVAEGSVQAKTPHWEGMLAVGRCGWVGGWQGGNAGWLLLMLDSTAQLSLQWKRCQWVTKASGRIHQLLPRAAHDC